MISKYCEQLSYLLLQIAAAAGLIFLLLVSHAHAGQEQRRKLQIPYIIKMSDSLHGFGYRL